MTLHRFYSGQVEPLNDNEVAGIAISAGVKRDGDEWVPSGVDLTAYRSNPVILRDHDQSMVIGTATAIGLTEDGSAIAIRIQFASPGISDVADEARVLAKAGILRGISAGIMPIESEALGGGWLGRRIVKSELLEVSLCAVPADQDALVTARSFRSAMLRHLPMVSMAARARALGRVSRVKLSGQMTAWEHTQAEIQRVRTTAAIMEMKGTPAYSSPILERAERQRVIDQLRAEQEILQGATRQ